MRRRDRAKQLEDNARSPSWGRNGGKKGTWGEVEWQATPSRVYERKELIGM